MSKQLRSRGGIAAGALLALCLAALPALAQGDRPVTSKKDMGDTVKINVSGNVVLDYVWRSREVATFTETVGPSGNENTFEGYASVRIDAELSEKVSAVIEVGTKRVDNGLINEWGNPGAEPINLREAGVRISEILNPNVSLHVGLTNWAFDVRGKGSAFALDPRHSQAITRNLSTTEDTGAAALAGRASTPEELESVGAVVSYARDQIALNLVLLPAAIEGGSSNNDEALYALDFWYTLDTVGKGSRLGLVIARHSHGFSRESAFFTFGGGVDLMLMDGALELYGEAYFQFGNAGRNPIDGDDVDAGGMALQVGLQYTFQGDIKPWVGVNFTMVSGDDSALATDDDADAFMSYENVNDLSIIENMYLGFDWDTNYTAIKVMGGIALSVGAGKNNLELSAILGFCNATEEVQFATGEDALGTEFDLKARWILSKQAAITGTFAYLAGSDILEESMGGAANPDAEDNAMLYTLGVDLRF